MSLRVVDLFAGAGGASTGLKLAAQRLGIACELTAINHWPAAVKTHAANHPEDEHLCARVEQVDPREVVTNGRLHLLVAGPECTHHSQARGGRPINDQSRATAWDVLRWCDLLRVDAVLIENVPEFRTWGPLDSRNRPLKRRKGETYRSFLRAFESMGYTVEDRLVNAADYGEATTRTRLFIQARRGRGPIAWPTPTHHKRGGTPFFGPNQTWRPARDVIDWSLKGTSIFTRERPLAPATLRRIQEGLKRFGGGAFLLSQASGGAPRTVEEPTPTITTDGAVSFIQPFVVNLRGTEASHIRASAGSVEDPLRTISAGGTHHAVVEPFLVPMYGERDGQSPRTHSVYEPVPTIPASGGGKFGIVEPFIMPVTHGGDRGRVRSTHEPLPTITSANRGELALVEPFTMPYCSNGGQLARPVSQPMGTITTRDRISLVQPANGDILFRMLQPHELAAAMGFPDDYRFVGNKGETIRMIGNAWSVRVAQALCESILSRWATKPVLQPTAGVA